MGHWMKRVWTRAGAAALLGVVAGTAQPRVRVLLGHGDGTFTKTPASPIAFGTELSYIAAGSMSTSHDDLLVADRSDNTVTRLHVLRLVGGQLQDIAGSPVSFPEYVGLDIQVVRTPTFDGGLVAAFALPHVGEVRVVSPE